jgi:hypothetical protein
MTQIRVTGGEPQDWKRKMHRGTPPSQRPGGGASNTPIPGPAHPRQSPAPRAWPRPHTLGHAPQ